MSEHTIINVSTFWYFCFHFHFDIIFNVDTLDESTSLTGVSWSFFTSHTAFAYCFAHTNTAKILFSSIRSKFVRFFFHAKYMLGADINLNKIKISTHFFIKYTNRINECWLNVGWQLRVKANTIESGWFTWKFIVHHGIYKTDEHRN